MKLIVLCLCWLCWSGLGAIGPAYAGDTDWGRFATTHFTNIGRAQGLPHLIVMALAQDGEGFIWLGTQGGLARYDGYRFRSYFHADDDPWSLPNTVVTALASDDGGQLWVGGPSGGVARYDSATDRFIPIPAPPGAPKRGGVAALTPDGAGGMWIGSSTGLEHVVPGRGDGGFADTPFTHAEQDPASLPNDKVRALLRSADGSLWVGTNIGLARLAPGATGFEVIPITGLDGHPLRVAVVGLLQDSGGRIWFGTERQGIGRLLPVAPQSGTVARQWTTARMLDSVPPVEASGSITFALAEGRPGEIWVGMVTDGLSLVDAQSGRRLTTTIRHDPLIPTALADDGVRAMLRDRSGLMWVATNVGVSRTGLNDAVVDNILPRSVPGGLPDPNVLSMAADADGRVWMGFKRAGAYVMAPGVETMTPLRGHDGRPLSSVTSMVADAQGQLWVGAVAGRSLLRLDADGQTLSPAPGFPGAIGGTVTSILPHAGALWVGAGALVRYDPHGGPSTVYRHGPDDATLTEESVTALRPAGDGGLWVGTRRGLDRLDIASGGFQHLTHDVRQPDSLPSDFVSTLMVDRRGRLWVGTLGGGIGIMTVPAADSAPFDPAKAHFRRLSTRDGMPSDNIGALQEDARGRVWVSTADGIAVIDPETLAVNTLGRGDGLAIDAYWLNSAARTPDGLLLFGGGGGVSVVHPERYTPWTYSPPVAVTALRVNGRPEPAGRADLAGGIVLGPHERNVEVEFASLDYSDPARLRYTYKLQGFDEDWISTDAERRVASYTNLPPGQYTLMLRGTNRAGTWSSPRLIPIHVEAAWWQTTWWRVAMATMALGAVFALTQARTAYLRHRRQMLEDLVARQTRDLTAANHRLEELASRDSLTNIYNRRYFVELTDRDLERARRDASPVSLAIIDLDHFKQVNDNYGHLIGDEVLRLVVEKIAQGLRTTDLFARIGGEEFAVLMPGTPAPAAQMVAERLRQMVAEQAYATSGALVPVTISVGLATTTPPIQSLDLLMDRADKALYAAKRRGRNRVEVADAGPHTGPHAGSLNDWTDRVASRKPPQ